VAIGHSRKSTPRCWVDVEITATENGGLQGVGLIASVDIFSESDGQDSVDGLRPR
jgi:hypothetical protein